MVEAPVAELKSEIGVRISWSHQRTMHDLLVVKFIVFKIFRDQVLKFIKSQFLNMELIEADFACLFGRRNDQRSSWLQHPFYFLHHFVVLVVMLDSFKAYHQVD